MNQQSPVKKQSLLRYKEQSTQTTSMGFELGSSKNIQDLMKSHHKLKKRVQKYMSKINTKLDLILDAVLMNRPSDQFEEDQSNNNPEEDNVNLMNQDQQRQDRIIIALDKSQIKQEKEHLQSQEQEQANINQNANERQIKNYQYLQRAIDPCEMFQCRSHGRLRQRFTKAQWKDMQEEAKRFIQGFDISNVNIVGHEYTTFNPKSPNCLKLRIKSAEKGRTIRMAALFRFIPNLVDQVHIYLQQNKVYNEWRDADKQNYVEKYLIQRILDDDDEADTE